MAPSSAPDEIPRPATTSDNDWRSNAAFLLNNTITIVIFGVGFPLMFALGGWAAGMALRPLAVPRRDRFTLVSREVLLLEVALVLALGAWAFLPRRSRVLVRTFAIALSVGVALAAAYALTFWAGAMRAVAGLYSDLGNGGLVLAMSAVASIPTLTAAVFYCQARTAWMLCATHGKQHPHRMVLTVAGSSIAGCALMMYLGARAQHIAVERLESGRPDAIEHSMRPLRLAAALRGEDRILDDVYWDESDSLLRRNFDEAFRRLTGQTAADRFAELHRD